MTIEGFSVLVDVPREARCGTCNKPIEAEADVSRNNNVTITVDPCESCIDDAVSRGRNEEREAQESDS